VTVRDGSSEESGLTDPPDADPPPELLVPPTGEGSADVGLDVRALGQRAVGQLVVRAIVVRGITLLGTIALARLLTPSEFGAFAVVTVLVTFLAILGDFGTSAALIQQDHDPTSIELSTAFVTQLGVWTTTGIVIWVTAGALPTVWPGLPPDVTGIARLLAVALFVGGLRAVPTVMLSRVLRFGPLAIVEIGQQIVYFGSAVALAALGYGIWSFAIAGLAQSVFATVVINVAWGRWFGLRFDRRVARRLWGFGIAYQAGNALTWGRDAVVPSLGWLAGGLDAIGFLGFAWRNGQLVTAVEQIVQRVAFPAFSRLQRDPERQGAMAGTAIQLVMLAVATIQGWIVATAPILVPIVFTDRWTPAIVPLQIVCLGSLATGPMLVLRALVYARGESRRALALTAAGLLVLLAAFPLLAIQAGLGGAALALAISSYVGLGLFTWATRATVTFPWPAVVRIVAVVAAAAVVGALVALAVPTLAGLFVSGVAYLAVVAGLVFVADRPLAERAVGLLSRVRG
jgi:PST family polysaccharide transporter